MKDIFTNNIPLLAILLLAAALRFVDLSSNPCGLFRDEADKGYSTYSLLETGRDLSGRVWPLQIKAFNAYTSPFYHWFSLPFVAGGLTVFSIRILSALAGTAACLAVFLLGNEWGGRRTGLVAALFLAVSPWHLLMSRWANQGILMTVFVPLAVWLTWKCVHGLGNRSGKRTWGLGIGASFFWALAWNAYAPARLFVPLLLISVLAVEALAWKTNRRAPLAVFLIGSGTVLFISPFLFDILSHWGETQARLRFLAGDTPFDPAVFAVNYLSHWNPVFLFWSGDSNLRHHFFAHGQGQMTWLEGLACLLGIAALVKGEGRWRGWLVAWLLLAPVPAAITREGLPHALRTLMVVPALAVLAGVGVDFLSRKVPDRLTRFCTPAVVVCLSIQACISTWFFHFDYPERSAPDWEAGMVEAIRTVENVRREGEICTVSGIVEFPESIIQFVVKPDPAAIQNGQGIPGYRFLETGRPFDPRRDDRAGLFLLRYWEARKPPWWDRLNPEPSEAEMDRFWRLYRSKGVS